MSADQASQLPDSPSAVPPGASARHCGSHAAAANQFDLKDVFIPDGIARENYVQRTDHVRRLHTAIDSYGLQYVLVGMQHTGKTTLVARELELKLCRFTSIRCEAKDTWDTLLDRAFDYILGKLTLRSLWERTKLIKTITLPGVKIELGRRDRRRDPQYLADLMARLRISLIIDDCQRLSSEARRGLPDLLRITQQVGAEKRQSAAKIFLISTQPLAHEIFAERSDLESRIIVDSLPPMSDEEIESVILKGARKLNVVVPSAMIREIKFFSGGSPLACHRLCRRICHARGVGRTASSPVELTMADFEVAIRELADENEAQVMHRLGRSARVQVPVSGLSSRQVLNELSHHERGSVSLALLHRSLRGFTPSLQRDQLQDLVESLSLEEHGGLLFWDRDRAEVRFADPMALQWIRIDLERASGRRRAERFADAIINAMREAR